MACSIGSNTLRSDPRLNNSAVCLGKQHGGVLNPISSRHFHSNCSYPCCRERCQDALISYLGMYNHVYATSSRENGENAKREVELGAIDITSRVAAHSFSNPFLSLEQLGRRRPPAPAKVQQVLRPTEADICVLNPSLDIGECETLRLQAGTVLAGLA